MGFWMSCRQLTPLSLILKPKAPTHEQVVMLLHHWGRELALELRLQPMPKAHHIVEKMLGVFVELGVFLRQRWAARLGKLTYC